MWVSTVKTNQGGDRDFSMYQDPLLKTVNIFPDCRDKLFGHLGQDFLNREFFKSRLGQVEIVGNNQVLSRFFKISQKFSTMKRKKERKKESKKQELNSMI